MASWRPRASLQTRAERRLGEILKRMAQGGERASANGSREAVSRGATRTLTDPGIPRDRASRAMQLAEVPQVQFDAGRPDRRLSRDSASSHLIRPTCRAQRGGRELCGSRRSSASRLTARFA
jgi:hypothetical protein